MNSHTPGPWAVDGLTVQAGGDTVCWMGEPAQFAGDTPQACANDAANARLISAAPELYDALKAIIDEHDSLIDGMLMDGDYIRWARAALAKVEG